MVTDRDIFGFGTKAEREALRLKARKIKKAREVKIPPLAPEPKLEPLARIAEIEALLTETMPQQERIPLEQELAELKPTVAPLAPERLPLELEPEVIPPPVPEAEVPLAPELTPIPGTDFTLNAEFDLRFKEYRRFGGTLDVTSWIQAGTPLRIVEEVLPVELQQERLDGAITAVFPDTSIEEFISLIEESPAIFWNKIQTGDSRVAKRQLLSMMGYTPEEINQILNFQKMVVEVDGVSQQVTIDIINKAAFDQRGNFLGRYNAVTQEFTKAPQENIAKDFIDWTFFQSRAMWENLENFALSVLPEIIYAEIPENKEERGFIEKTFSEGFVDFLNETSRQQREDFRWLYGQNKEQYDEWVSKHPELLPPANYQEGAFQNPELLKDPRYYAYELASITPFILTATLMAVATGGVGLPAMFGTAAIMTPIEGQGVYEDLINAGAPRDKAAELALVAGGLIGALESVGRIPLLKMVSPLLMGRFKKEATKQLVKRTIAEAIKRFGRNYTIVQFSEVATEVMQEVVANTAVRFFDENRSILENTPDIAVKTAVATIVPALLGAGVSIRQVRPSLTEGLSDAQMKARGWIKDIKTGKWYEKISEVVKREEGFVRIPGEEPIKHRGTELEGIKIGDELGVRYDGIQEGFEELPSQMMFTDPQTGSTFVAATLEGARTRLAAMRAEFEAKPPAVEEVARPEPGAPEVGIQETMLPGEISAREFRPAGKGRQVQISMEDQLKLQQARDAAEEAPAEDVVAYEAQEEIEGLNATHESDPVATTKFKLGGKNVGLDAFISIREQAFPETFTLKQAQAIKPNVSFSFFTQKGTPQFNKVPRADVLDELAGKWNMTPDEIADRVMEIRREKGRIKEAEAEIKKHYTEKPLTPKTELTTTEVTENWETIGRPKMTMAQARALAGFFGDYVLSEDAVTAHELQRELFSRTRAERSEDFKARMQELIVTQGVGVEEAFKQASSETLAGELPRVSVTFFEGMSDELRAALFAIVYHNKILQQYPLEMASTITALTNAIGTTEEKAKAIPRKKGTGTPLFPEGGSAWDRLALVFGPQTRAFKAIDKMASEGKNVKDIIEALFEITGKDPVPIDQETADYLRKLQDIPQGYKTLLEPPFDNPQVTDLRDPADVQFAKADLELTRQFADGKLTFEEFTLERLKASEEAFPVSPVPKFDAPVDKAFKQAPLLNGVEKSLINRIFKEFLMSPIDIGNFLRANMASVDMSFWRQQKTLIAGHPVAFYRANVEAFKALFHQKDAEANWEWITRRPLFHLYDQIGVDFLRPLELPPGTAQWRGIEEFGYLTGERLLPRLTAKIPWVKLSARAFVTGTNTHNWLVFETLYRATQRRAEKIASGEIVLKEGEAFDMVQEMTDYAKMITDFTQRAQLGERLGGLAPALGALFFAPRSKLGRLLTPRHLLSRNPRVRVEAWKDLTLFVTAFGGLVMTGYMLGLWDVETDPRNAEFMSIRIGNMRIDPWGGHRQFVVLYSRLLTKTGLSSVTGAEYEVNPLSALQSFVRFSLSPMTSIIVDFATGTNVFGEKMDATDGRQWAERIAPFSVQDMWDAFEEDWKLGTIAILPAIFGEGVQTYTGEWKENFTKLGLPKYLENIAYGITEPRYDMQDLYADTSSQFTGVDPETLTEAKGFPPYIKALAEVKVIKKTLDTLPNERLVSINADRDKGLTFIDYYEQWEERQKLVDAGDKAELTRRELQPDGKYKTVTYKGEDALRIFDSDEKTRNAQLGNMSQSQYSLLIEYHSITDKTKQKEFLELHEGEIGINPRQEWLRSHTKDNGLLAIWGQAKVFSKEALDEVIRLGRAWGIPESAIPKQALPPKTSLDTHWTYQDMVSEGTHGTLEADLLLVKDAEASEKAGVRSYADWAGLTLTDTPIEVLELKVKHRALSDEYAGYSNKDSEFYIEDDTKREEARKKLKADNQEWVDDMRRVEAIEDNGTDFQDAWIDRGHTIDEFEAGSSEALVWLLDNPDAYRWAIDNELLEDRMDELLEHEPVLRLNVQYRVEDKEYGELKTDDDREAYLAEHSDYYEARYRRQAYQKDIAVIFHAEYIEWNTSPNLKKPDDWEDRTNQDKWYEDDWYLQEHSEFHQMMVDKEIWKELRDFRLVPTKEVFNKWLEYSRATNRVEKDKIRTDNPDLDAWGTQRTIEGKVFIWEITMTERRRRLRITPSERFQERLGEEAEEFRRGLAELK